MKMCSKCIQAKPFSEFNRKGDGFQPWCRSCNAIRSRQYYADNKEKHLEVIKKRKLRVRQETQKKYIEYLSNHPCADCGESDTIVLEPDHIRDKEHNVSKMIQSGHSWKNILLELEKCEIVCCNCHRRRSFSRCNSYRTGV